MIGEIRMDRSNYERNWDVTRDSVLDRVQIQVWYLLNGKIDRKIAITGPDVYIWRPVWISVCVAGRDFLQELMYTSLVTGEIDEQK